MQEELQRLRSACPGLREQEERRRFGLRCGAGTKSVRFVNKVLCRLLECVWPQSLSAEPCADALARIRRAFEHVDHRARQRALEALQKVGLSEHIHPRVLECLTRPPPASEDEETARLFEACRLRVSRARFQSMLHALARSPVTSLEQAARFCVAKPGTARQRLLVCAMGFSETALEQAVQDLQRQRKQAPKKNASPPRFREQSPWHAALFDDILAAERDNTDRTAFPAQRLQQVRRMLERFLTGLDTWSRGRLRTFLASARQEDLEEAVREWLRGVRLRNDRVKARQRVHQASYMAHFALRFLGCGAMRKRLGLGKFTCTAKTLLSGVPNRRVAADPTVRRTFTDEECEAMLRAARDPAEALCLTLLREVGLRASALASIKYETLLDEDDMPRKQCSVMEKGNQRRIFLTSEGMRSKIQAVADMLRKAYPGTQDFRGCYFLNVANIHKPCTNLRYLLERIARDANIQGVRVHPHVFRHTLVGKLIEVGNTLEVVSKFMGHSSPTTTANCYWIPTPQQLHIINPFINPVPTRVERENVQLTAATRLLSLSLADPDTRKRLKERVPDLDVLVHQIAVPSPSLPAAPVHREPEDQAVDTDFY